jgi:ribosome-associated protein
MRWYVQYPAPMQLEPEYAHRPGEDRRDHLWLPDGRVVPPHAVRWSAVTAGGPGGQHANRSATRVEVRMLIAGSGLSGSEQERVFERCAGRISPAGELVAWAGERRSQLQNRRAALRRIESLIAGALHEDAPRVPTKVPRAVRERRLDAKRRRAQRKRSRQWRPDSEE